MKNATQSVLASLVAALLLAACGGETRTRPQTCSSDAQCTGGTVCKSGTCQTPSSNTTGACTKSSDCAAGYVCDAGECTENDGSGACTTAMDCPEEQYCQAGACVGGDDTDTGTPCANDSDCDDGVCNNAGYCVGCLTTTDCPDGETCTAGQTCSGDTTCASDADCTNGTRCKIAANPKVCVQCLEDSDCARSIRKTRGSSAKVCRDNVCTNPTTTCSSNADCGSLACVSGSCTACTSSSQCSSGQTCNTSSGTCGSGTQCTTSADCGGVACLNGKCENCTNDSDCTSTSNGTTSYGLCTPSTGKCGALECTTANDCDSGEACYAPGRCGPCVADSECRSGEYCYIAPSDTTGWCYAGTSGSCTTNAQCASDLVCYNKQCTTCLSTSECDAGETCSWSGRCTGGSSSGTQCTSSTQCAWNQTCVNSYCVTNPSTGTGSGSFGSSCTNTSQCAAGLFCAGLTYDTSICTAVCTGSGYSSFGGLNSKDDCPSGYACVDWEDSTLDGLKFCMSANQLGSDALGYPFTTPPGGACSASSNSCQTSVCDGSSCVRMCNSMEDCEDGSSCYAHYESSLGYIHMCLGGDRWGRQGDSCSENEECNSGICLGACSASGNPCGSSSECGSNEYCAGTCAEHCRSYSTCYQLAGTEVSCNYWPMYRDGGYYSGWTPVCSGAIYQNYAHVGLGGSCSNDSDCYSEWCIDGVCTTPCATQNDCAVGGMNTGCTAVNFYSGNTPVYSGSFCL